MKNHLFDQPGLFDREFRPKRWPFALGAAFLGVFLVIFLYRFIVHIMEGKPADWGLFGGTGAFALFFVGMVLATWLYPKLLMVGLNQDGMFVRKYGMVYWDDIKNFKIGYLGAGKHRQKFLWIILHSPDDFFTRNKIGRLMRLSSFNKVAIASHSVSIKLEDLLVLLRDYHKQNL